MNINSPVELGCSPEEASRWRSRRLNGDADYSSYPISKLTVDPAEIYSQMQAAEHALVLNEDYVLGSAQEDDEVLLLPGDNVVLLTAEHATSQQRADGSGVRKLKSYDTGTGGLVSVVASSLGSTALIATGRQSGDANNDVSHPFKDQMTKIIIDSSNRAHFSAHGMAGGAAANITDEKGFKVMVGIGNKPSNATKALADFMLQIASDYELRIGINQPQMRFDTKTKMPIMDDEGRRVKRITFAGGGAGTTRTYAQTIAEESGKRDEYAAVQLELSTSVRLLSSNFRTYRSEGDAQIGATLGYLFLRDAVKSVSRL